MRLFYLFISTKSYFPIHLMILIHLIILIRLIILLIFLI